MDLRFVLCSPTAPQKLDHTAWQTWALTDTGQPHWLTLPVPRLRVATERCDSDGHASAAGERWRIAEPLA